MNVYIVSLQDAPSVISCYCDDALRKWLFFLLKSRTLYAVTSNRDSRNGRVVVVGGWGWCKRKPNGIFTVPIRAYLVTQYFHHESIIHPYITHSFSSPTQKLHTINVVCLFYGCILRFVFVSSSRNTEYRFRWQYKTIRVTRRTPLLCYAALKNCIHSLWIIILHLSLFNSLAPKRQTRTWLSRHKNQRNMYAYTQKFT